MRKYVLALVFAMCCVAFGNAVRSAVGARLQNVVSQGGSSFTAADYIQEGLIAMWDGIENAGYGIHEDVPEKWIDLTGGGGPIGF